VFDALKIKNVAASHDSFKLYKRSQLFSLSRYEALVIP
jgi:hypothetical protein